VSMLKSTTPSPGVDRGEERVAVLLKHGRFQEGGRGLRQQRCSRVDRSRREAEVCRGAVRGSVTVLSSSSAR
jgi:hypothetical protein